MKIGNRSWLIPALFALVVAVAPTTSKAGGGQDIVDLAAGNQDFETLVAALKAADLVDALKGEGPYTVFAPTDDAFAKLPEGTLDNLMKPENKDELASILTYHVVPGRVTAADIAGGRSMMETLEGSSLTVNSSDGKVMVNEAQVVQPDLMATNGVIHVIDSVILPTS